MDGCRGRKRGRAASTAGGGSWAGSRLETLEDRKLLSGGMGSTGAGFRWVWPRDARAAEMSAFQGGRQAGSSEAGHLVWAGA